MLNPLANERRKPGAAAVLAAVTVSACVLAQTPAASADSDDLIADGIVVKLESASPAALAAMVANHPVGTPEPMLASRGIYLVQPADLSIASDLKELEHLAKDLEKSWGVDYAEPNYDTSLADDRLHSWPQGTPVDAGSDPAPWQTQAFSSYLNLAEAHKRSTGAGTVVAVLDSGVDAKHPALSGRLVEGYDYVDDDDDPSDDADLVDSNDNGIPDEAHGHGTFVAGVVLLVAPDARVMPMRVLNSDGSGNIFTLAAAVSEAVEGGADVINLSLGTKREQKSDLLKDVIKDAQKQGVIVVAAAGNGASEDHQYPAKQKNVLSVGSTNDDGTDLSDFSNWGDWVDVATPANRVLGPVPGGGYAWWAGTSMAAPQVSGQLALIHSLASRDDDDDDDDKKKASEKNMESVTKTTRKMTGKKIKNGSIDLLASLARAGDDDDD